MAKLIPAILSQDASEVMERMEFLESIPEIDEVQIDFADGEFVPNRTVLPNELSSVHQNFEVEAHMMVKNPQQYFNNLELLGVETVIVHYESFDRLDDLETALRNIHMLGMKRGVAVNPNTQIEIFNQFVNQSDIALILGVFPGFQGRKFVGETYERIKTLRKKHPDAIIEVDGGVKLDNAGMVKASGADRVVVGSGIWVSQDPEETIREFLTKLTQ